ncbi:hypothetical protein N7466_003195 [Penicillium verhagenii]|uniref:uncharacterized protein n=1 Tax=Penicillium verhagenii TaxID=1562060 RepID=UPI0025454900|nr:uncharacterized protein N7466_003195 [Penicillium verhagenii]KAJ5936745.1 hypothetical protein N7466_003195 [Penicillium verhagenii]
MPVDRLQWDVMISILIVAPGSFRPATVIGAGVTMSNAKRRSAMARRQTPLLQPLLAKLCTWE